MKKLTAKEKEEMRKVIREYHANSAIKFAKEVNQMGSPRGNIIKGWVQIIKSIFGIIKHR